MGFLSDLLLGCLLGLGCFLGLLMRFDSCLFLVRGLFGLLLLKGFFVFLGASCSLFSLPFFRLVTVEDFRRIVRRGNWAMIG